MEQANAEPPAAAVRLEDHRAAIEVATRSCQQLVLASNEDRSWGTDAGNLERGVLARLADFEIERTRAVNDAAAMSRQPRKHGGGELGCIAMVSAVRRGAHPIVENTLRWRLRKIKGTLVQKPVAPRQPLRVERTRQRFEPRRVFVEHMDLAHRLLLHSTATRL